MKRWQTNYGDFEFDKSKFPNISGFVTKLNDLGFRTTLWVHPFANDESSSFVTWRDNSLAVHTHDSNMPGLTSWWQGRSSLILDTTNPNASDWFVEKLKTLQRDAKIDSFKFDAGCHG